MNFKTADKLAKLRKEHGYSQEDLAEKLSVSRQAVSKWERGESSPDTDNLIALAVLYGVSLDELVGIFDEEKRDGSAKKSEEKEGFGWKRQEEDEDGTKPDDDFIFVRSDEGEEVRFGRNGLNLNDGKGTTVKIGPMKIGIKSNGQKGSQDKEEQKEWQWRGTHREKCGTTVNVNGVHVCAGGEESFASILEKVLCGFTFVIGLAAFLLWGFLEDGGWRTSWIALFFIPIGASFVNAMVHHDAARFAFPVLVTAIFLGLGMYLSVWHPAWAIFLSIPIYYGIIDFYKLIKRYGKERIRRDD